MISDYENRIMIVAVLWRWRSHINRVILLAVAQETNETDWVQMK